MPLTQTAQEAICDREGQVLFGHAVPLGLCGGDYFTDRLAPAETAFFARLSPETDALLCVDGRALLCLRRASEGLFCRLSLLAASPSAIVRTQVAAELACSPGLREAGQGSAGVTEVAEAALELRLALARDLVLTPRPLARILTDLADLPPLCARHFTFAPGPDLTLGGDWPLILYCLTAFLCRATDGATLTATAAGTDLLPVVMLAATPPASLPSGHTDLCRLAAHFPEAGELRVCSQLAARAAITVEARLDDAGRLSLIAAAQPDPAWFGLKQPTPFDEAREAVEAEWCRLLRAAVPAEK